MAGKPPDTGPTAAIVADNIKQLRTVQNLSYTQLSKQLKQRADWSISPVGVRRIENGERRISVDDLVAIAATFDIPPSMLLIAGQSFRIASIPT